MSIVQTTAFELCFPIAMKRSNIKIKASYKPSDLTPVCKLKQNKNCLFVNSIASGELSLIKISFCLRKSSLLIF